MLSGHPRFRCNCNCPDGIDSGFGLKRVLVNVLWSQTRSEGLAGHSDELVVGGARHGAQLKEVAGHGEAEDTAHGNGGS